MSLFTNITSGLSGILATTLSQVCGQYIENMDPKDLNVSIRKGKVELRDLKLRKDALDQLGLPVVVQRGTVDKLVVHVPWMNLTSKPLIIDMDTVYVTASERTVPPGFDMAAYNAYAQQRKDTALAAFEVDYQARAAARQLLANPNKPPPSGFVAKLVDSIVNNVQIQIRNVHICLEVGDALEFPFTLSVRMENLELQSTNADGQKMFVEPGSGVTYKSLKLSNFAVSLDTSGTRIPTDLNSAQWAKYMSAPPESYLLEPISLEGQLVLQSAETHTRNPTFPRLSLQVTMESMHATLSHLQLQALLNLAPSLQYFDSMASFRAMRPQFIPVGQPATPKALWQFAGQCIIQRWRMARKYKSMEVAATKIWQRDRYIQLHKQLQPRPWHAKLTNVQQFLYDKIQNDTNIVDLIKWRRVAYSELEIEDEKQRQFNMEPAKKSFFSWGKQDTPKDLRDFRLSDEERTALYEAIGYDGTAPEDVNPSPDAVDIALQFNMQQASVRLVDEEQGALMEAGLTLLDFQLLLKPLTTQVVMTVNDVDLTDLFCHDTQFKTLLCCQQGKDGSATARRHLPEASPPPETQEVAPAFLLVEYTSDATTSKLKAALGKTIIVVNPAWLQAIVQFSSFSYIPPASLELVFTAGTEAKPEAPSAATELDLHLAAPCIVVPDSCLSKECLAVVLDLGRLDCGVRMTEDAIQATLQWSQLEARVSPYDGGQLAKDQESDQVITPFSASAKVTQDSHGLEVDVAASSLAVQLSPRTYAAMLGTIFDAERLYGQPLGRRGDTQTASHLLGPMLVLPEGPAPTGQPIWRPCEASVCNIHHRITLALDTEVPPVQYVVELGPGILIEAGGLSQPFLPEIDNAQEVIVIIVPRIGGVPPMEKFLVFALRLQDNATREAVLAGFRNALVVTMPQWIVEDASLCPLIVATDEAGSPMSPARPKPRARLASRVISTDNIGQSDTESPGPSSPVTASPQQKTKITARLEKCSLALMFSAADGDHLYLDCQLSGVEAMIQLSDITFVRLNVQSLSAMDWTRQAGEDPFPLLKPAVGDLALGDQNAETQGAWSLEYTAGAGPTLITTTLSGMAIDMERTSLPLILALVMQLGDAQRDVGRRGAIYTFRAMKSDSSAQEQAAIVPMKITINTGGVHIFGMNKRSQIFDVVLLSGTSEITMQGAIFEMDGNFNGASVYFAALEGTPQHQIFAAQGDPHFLTISYHTAPNADTELDVNVSAAVLVYSPRCVTDMQRYFDVTYLFREVTEEHKQALASTLSTAAEEAETALWDWAASGYAALRYTVDLQSSTVRIPVKKEAGMRDAALLSFQRLQIDNAPKEAESVDPSKTLLASIHLKNAFFSFECDTVTPAPMAQALEMTLNVTQQHEPPTTHLGADISSVDFTVTKRQLDILLVLVQDGLVDTTYDPAIDVPWESVVGVKKEEGGGGGEEEEEEEGAEKAPAQPAQGTVNGIELQLDAHLLRATVADDAAMNICTPIASLAMTSVQTHCLMRGSSTSVVLFLASAVGTDERPGCIVYEKQFLQYTGVGGGVPMLNLNMTPEQLDVQLRMGDGIATMISPELVAALLSFSLEHPPDPEPQSPVVTHKVIRDAEEGNLEVFSSYSLDTNLHLSPQRKLIVRHRGTNEVTINGNKHTIFIPAECHISAATAIDLAHPAIVVESGMTCRLENCTIRLPHGALEEYIFCGEGATLEAGKKSKAFIRRKMRKLRTPQVFDAHEEAAPAKPWQVSVSLELVGAHQRFATLVPLIEDNGKVLGTLVLEYSMALQYKMDVDGSGKAKLSCSNFVAHLDPPSDDAVTDPNQYFYRDGDLAVIGPLQAQVHYEMVPPDESGAPAHNIKLKVGRCPVRLSQSMIVSMRQLQRSVQAIMMVTSKTPKTNEPAPPATKGPNAKLNVTAKGEAFTLLMIREQGGIVTPVADYTVHTWDANMVIETATGALEGAFNSRLSIQYYNFNLSFWEPLAESLSSTISMQRKLTAKPNGESGSHTIFSVVLQETLNLNLTPVMLGYGSRLAGFLQGLWESNPSIVKQPYTHRLLNVTGLPIVVIATSMTATSLPISEDREICLPDKGELQYCLHRDAHSLPIYFSGATGGPRMLQLATLQPQVLLLCSPGATPTNYDLAVQGHVTQRPGEHVMTLYSAWLLHNFTGVDMQIRTLAPDVHPSAPQRLANGAPFCIPSNVLQSSMSIQLRPGTEYDWSEPLSIGASEQPGRPLVLRVAGLKGVQDIFIAVRVNRMMECVAMSLMPSFTIQNLLPGPVAIGFFETPGAKAPKVTIGLNSGESKPCLSISAARSIYAAVVPPNSAYRPPANPILVHDPKDLSCREQVITCEARAPMPNLQLTVISTCTGITDSYRLLHIFCPYWVVNCTPNWQLKLRADHGTLPVPPDAKPVLVSVPQFGSVWVAVFDSNSDIPIPVDNVGTSGALTTLSKDGQKQYALGVHIQLGPGPFQRTKVVQLMPRFRLVNDTKDQICIRQADAQHVILAELPPKGEHIVQSWHHLKHGEEGRLRLQVRILHAGFDTEWSQPFDAGVFTYIVLRHRKQRSERKVLEVQVVPILAMLCIVFRPATMPPLQVVNLSFHQVAVRQAQERVWDHVHPFEAFPYYWADISKDQVLEVSTVEERISLLPNRLEGGNEHPLSPGLYVRSVLGRSGLVVYIHDPTNPIAEAYSAAALEQSSALDELQLEMHGSIGISLIGPRVMSQDWDAQDQNDGAQEIFYFHLQGIDAKYVMATDYSALQLSIAMVQCDDQDARAILPVSFGIRSTENHPAVHIACRLCPNSPIPHISYATVLIQHCHAFLSTSLIVNVASIMTSVFTQEDTFDGDIQHWVKSSVQIRDDGSAGLAKQRIYFGRLELHPIALDLTFVADTTYTGSTNAVVVLIDTLSMAIKNVVGAPIRLNACIMVQSLLPQMEFKQNLTWFYTQQFLFEMYKVLGSVQFLGNPVGLIGSLGTGIYDLFYEPAKALVDDPLSIASGIAKGTQSFGRHAVAGAANSATGITNSMASGLLVLALDDRYVQERRRKQRERPRNLGEGFMAGIGALRMSVASGVGGIIKKPLQGAEQDGVLGFLKGTVQGLTGALIKPISGVLDFAAQTTAGLRNAASSEGWIRRVRFPRYLPDGVVLPYDANMAMASTILRTVKKGQYASEILRHAVIPEEEMAQAQCFSNETELVQHVCLLTDKRVVMVKFMEDFPEKVWSIKMPVLVGCQVQGTRVHLCKRMSGFLPHDPINVFEVRCRSHDDAAKFAAKLAH